MQDVKHFNINKVDKQVNKIISSTANINLSSTTMPVRSSTSSSPLAVVSPIEEEFKSSAPLVSIAPSFIKSKSAEDVAMTVEIDDLMCASQTPDWSSASSSSSSSSFSMSAAAAASLPAALSLPSPAFNSCASSVTSFSSSSSAAPSPIASPSPSASHHYPSSSAFPSSSTGSGFIVSDSADDFRPPDMKRDVSVIGTTEGFDRFEPYSKDAAELDNLASVDLPPDAYMGPLAALTGSNGLDETDNDNAADFWSRSNNVKSENQKADVSMTNLASPLSSPSSSSNNKLTKTPSFALREQSTEYIANQLIAFIQELNGGVPEAKSESSRVKTEALTLCPCGLYHANEYNENDDDDDDDDTVSITASVGDHDDDESNEKENEPEHKEQLPLRALGQDDGADVEFETKKTKMIKHKKTVKSSKPQDQDQPKHKKLVIKTKKSAAKPKSLPLPLPAPAPRFEGKMPTYTHHLLPGVEILQEISSRRQVAFEQLALVVAQSGPIIDCPFNNMKKVIKALKQGAVAERENFARYTKEKRAEVVAAYREKRKNRVWGSIKYVNRKRFADSRPRVGGRFTKLKD